MKMKPEDIVGFVIQYSNRGGKLVQIDDTVPLDKVVVGHTGYMATEHKYNPSDVAELLKDATKIQLCYPQDSEKGQKGVYYVCAKTFKKIANESDIFEV